MRSHVSGMVVWFFAVIYRAIKVFVETIKDHEFKTLFILMAVVLTIGTVFYMNVEKLSLIDAFYFSSITVTTVGYGDITPHTEIGKLFTIFYLFTGIGILLSFVNVIANHALKDRVSARLDHGFSNLRVPGIPRLIGTTAKKKYNYRPR
jgi:hypothetical protein